MDWKVLYSEKHEEWKLYLDSLYPYFDICRDKNVLDIGPYIGIQSQVILSQSPKELTLIEPNKSACTTLKNTFNNENVNVNVINDDVFLYLQNIHPFDVVVCCGVLYHFHSPLYFLELIANRISPQYIILETFTQILEIHEEGDNTPGARHLMNEWKSVNMSLKIPKEIIITAMENLGYKLKTKDETIIKPHVTKRPFFCIFEKV